MIDIVLIGAIVVVPFAIMAVGFYRLLTSGTFRWDDDLPTRLRQTWAIFWPAMLVALAIGGVWIVGDSLRG